MKLLRVSTSESGESYFGEVEWPLRQTDFAPPSPPGYSVTEAMPAQSVRVLRTPANYVDDWHPVPGRVLVALLSGRARVETSDGDTRFIERGQLVLFEDDWGKGHRINEVDGLAYDISLTFLCAPS